jgi:hypothetical protein
MLKVCWSEEGNGRGLRLNGSEFDSQALNSKKWPHVANCKKPKNSTLMQMKQATNI